MPDNGQASSNIDYLREEAPQIVRKSSLQAPVDWTRDALRHLSRGKVGVNRLDEHLENTPKKV